jgi:C-terminal processing protease CtpA/Prc
MSGWGDEKVKVPLVLPDVVLEDEAFSFSLDDDDFSLTTFAEPMPWLGLGLQEMDALESLLTAEGVRIIDLAPLAPAKEAGFEKEDILTRWNEELALSATVVQERIALLKIGEEVKLTVQRGGDSHSFKVKAADKQLYPWKDFWRPGLPDFEATEGVERVFEEDEAEFEALKRQFEALEKSAEELKEK